MKIEIYPAYHMTDWCTILRAKDKTKILEGTDYGVGREKIYLKALLKGLRKLKKSVDLEIYTQLKRIEIALGEKRIHYWAKNSWNEVDPDCKTLWKETKKQLDKHKKIECVRCRYNQNVYFYEAYKKCL